MYSMHHLEIYRRWRWFANSSSGEQVPRPPSCECEVDSMSKLIEPRRIKLHNCDAHLCITIMERYRSGHNGADSKAAHDRHFYLSASPWSTSLFRDFKCRNFRGWSTVFYQNSKPKFNTERYRSGHNGADSKSVCAQAHEGSNPSLSAKAAMSAS